VLVIEHNLDVIKTADWIVVMGPEGGSRGGLVVAEGTPEQVAAAEESFTGQFLAPLLEGTDVPVAKAPRKKVAAKAPAGKPTTTKAAKKSVVAKKTTTKKTSRKTAKG
jgi:excinuclease ABC subunit A